MKKYPTDIKKLKLKLVTNRVIEEQFKNLLDNCIVEIEKNNCTKYLELKKLLHQEYHSLIQVVHQPHNWRHLDKDNLRAGATLSHHARLIELHTD